MAEARPIARAFSPRIWLAGGWLLVLLLAAIFAPWVAPHDPLAQDLLLERLPPPGCQAPSRVSTSAPTASAGTCCRA